MAFGRSAKLVLGLKALCLASGVSAGLLGNVSVNVGSIFSDFLGSPIYAQRHDSLKRQDAADELCGVDIFGPVTCPSYCAIQTDFSVLGCCATSLTNDMLTNCNFPTVCYDSTIATLLTAAYGTALCTDPEAPFCATHIVTSGALSGFVNLGCGLFPGEFALTPLVNAAPTIAVTGTINTNPSVPAGSTLSVPFVSVPSPTLSSLTSVSSLNSASITLPAVLSSTSNRITTTTTSGGSIVPFTLTRQTGASVGTTGPRTTVTAGASNDKGFRWMAVWLGCIATLAAFR